MAIYSEVSPIEFNKTYAQEKVYRIAILITLVYLKTAVPKLTVVTSPFFCRSLFFPDLQALPSWIT